MAQTVIGLDVGTWSIKAAALESTLRGFSLVEVAEHHLPRGADGALLDLSLIHISERAAPPRSAPQPSPVAA